MNPSPRRRAVAAACLLAGVLGAAAPAQAADPQLDLENLSAAQLATKLQDGSLTSEQLTRAYINRIAALNKRGPSLNAVRLINPTAIAEAKASDARRKQGDALGVLEGLPVLVKDNVDVAGLPTTAGSIALERNVPASDSPAAAKLRAAGAVLLGKTNLSEFANFFSSGTNPSGYSSLGGQVLNATDATSTPSGSSSGSGVAASVGLAALTIGSETSGSIISPSAANGIVGLRPTVGLVSRTGVIPISATQDTLGPMVRTVTDAAMELQAIAGKDPEDPATASAPDTVPDYLTGLKPDALKGVKLGVINNSDATYQAAIAAVQAAGATTTLTALGSSTPTRVPGSPSILSYEFKRDLNAYLARVKAKGGQVQSATLDEVVTYNRANPVEGTKFGQGTLISSNNIDTDALADENAANVENSITTARSAIDVALKRDDADPSNDLDALLTPSGTTTGVGARAQWPQITVPAGFSATSRNPIGIAFQGRGYEEAKLLAYAYAFEQATKARTGPSKTNPAMLRCAQVRDVKPFAERSCMPTGEAILAAIGTAPQLDFSLEAATAAELTSKLKARTLSSVTLTKAYLARIAAVDVAGPALNTVRSLNPRALDDAAKSDEYRRTHATPRPLEGLPVLVKDDLDVAGLPTTGGSIALEDTVPKANSTVVAKLRAAGAIVLGKTNMTELNNLMASTTTVGGQLAAYMPAGYSSLGGQVLNPYDTDLVQGGGGPGASTANTSIVGNGGSAGSAAAAAAGLAAMTVGTETNGSIVFPATANSVVGMRPTLGLVSRWGMLPAARSQDTPGPLGRTVTDVAAQLQVLAGKDPDDPATAGAPTSPPDYVTGLTASALQGKRVGVTNSTNANYVAVKAALTNAGATLVTVSAPAAPATASVFAYELKRDVNAFLGSAERESEVRSLRGLIAYNEAHEDEGLKYNQGQLLAAQQQDTSAGSADTATYQADLAAGRAAARAAIDGVLNAGTPADASDDLAAIVLPQDSRTQDTTYVAGARAGYPQISVPAGYNQPATETSATTHDPVGVTFLGAAGGDAALLGLAYAYEQAAPGVKVGTTDETLARKVPSAMNPATWRCSPDSVFPARSCAPGAFLAEEPPAPGPTPGETPGGGVPPAGGTPVAPASTPPVTPITVPVPSVTRPTINRSTSFRVARKTRQVALRVRCGVTAAGRCRGTIRLRHGSTVLATRTFSIPADQVRTVRLTLRARTYRTLAKRKRLSATVGLTTIGADGTTRGSTVRVTLRA